VIVGTALLNLVLTFVLTPRLGAVGRRWRRSGRADTDRVTATAGATLLGVAVLPYLPLSRAERRHVTRVASFFHHLLLRFRRRGLPRAGARPSARPACDLHAPPVYGPEMTSWDTTRLRCTTTWATSSPSVWLLSLTDVLKLIEEGDSDSRTPAVAFTWMTDMRASPALPLRSSLSTTVR